MQVYKRSLWVMVKGLIYAPPSGFVVYIAARFFTDNDAIAGGLGVLMFLSLAYLSVFSENVYFELEQNGVFRYYKRGKLQSAHDVKKCQVGYRRKSSSSFLSTDDIQLDIQEEGKEKVTIDCSPIGETRFYKLFEKLDEMSLNSPEVLSAKPIKEE
ncbi:MAG: hypothetical protein LBD04_06925 [Synergistaceae bacterium]|jgi:hypothetical protein|nr:hypothetical protein [Synergistaceae bacterium]